MVDDMMDVELYYSSLPVDAVPELLMGTGFTIERMKKDYKERDMEKALVALFQKSGEYTIMHCPASKIQKAPGCAG